MPMKKRTDDPQKNALYALLRKRFGRVERERKFDWLLIPPCAAPADCPVDYRKIVKALCKHRGRTGFCDARSRDTKLRCDFVVADHKLIVEYDERQHFTASRKIALKHYPSDVVLPYPAADWMNYCDEIDAHDNDPPYRDEQRAFYDSVRDIAAFRNGWTLLRIKDGNVNWKTANLKTLDDILNHGRHHDGSQRKEKTMRTKTHNGNDKTRTDTGQKCPDLQIRKLGIVARDYNKTKDFKASLPNVLQLLDKKGCDAVLFSLFSLKSGYDPREAFKGLKKIKAVFVEEFAEKRGPEKTMRVGKAFVVYYRTSAGWKEYRCTQCFASLNGMSPKRIRDFVDEEMPGRILGNCGVLLCGESNGVKYKRADGKVHDVFGLRKSLPGDVEVILNPCHDYMRRPEMKMKRGFLSQKKRWVISVWCKGKGKESDLPWTVFYNGKERCVDEIVHDFDSKAVHVGILEIQ